MEQIRSVGRVGSTWYGPKCIPSVFHRLDIGYDRVPFISIRHQIFKNGEHNNRSPEARSIATSNVMLLRSQYLNRRAAGIDRIDAIQVPSEAQHRPD